MIPILNVFVFLLDGFYLLTMGMLPLPLLGVTAGVLYGNSLLLRAKFAKSKTT